MSRPRLSLCVRPVGFAFLAALVATGSLAGCDSGGSGDMDGPEPDPTLNKFSITVDGVPNMVPGQAAQASATCNAELTDGTTEAPDSLKFLVDGEQVGETATDTDEIQKAIPAETTGQRSLEARCYWGIGTDRNPTDKVGSETTPYNVDAREAMTLSLHDLTKEGEPAVTGQGETDYVIKRTDQPAKIVQPPLDTTITSTDSASLPVPPGNYSVQATNDNFYQPWSIIQEQGQADFARIGYTDVRSPQDTIENADNVNILQIRKDAWTQGDLDRTDMTHSQEPLFNEPYGSMRFPFKEADVQIYINESASDSIPEQAVEEIKEYASGTNPRTTLAGFTDGALQDVPVVRERPDKPYIEVSFGHNTIGVTFDYRDETTDTVIDVAHVDLLSNAEYKDKDRSIHEEIANATGVRDVVRGNEATFTPFVESIGLTQNEYNRFGQLAGKIHHWFPADTKWRE